MKLPLMKSRNRSIKFRVAALKNGVLIALGAHVEAQLITYSARVVL
jgi:hypothetical protein